MFKATKPTELATQIDALNSHLAVVNNALHDFSVAYHDAAHEYRHLCGAVDTLSGRIEEVASFVLSALLRPDPGQEDVW